MKLLITSVVAGMWWLAFLTPDPVFFGGQLWPILVGLVVLVLVPTSLTLEVTDTRVVRVTIEQTQQPKAA